MVFAGGFKLSASNPALAQSPLTKYVFGVFLCMKIIRTKSFDADFRRIGATDGDFDGLVRNLGSDPEAGDRIKGLKGVRKIRFALPSRKTGKSGGGRAIYLALVVDDAVVLIMAYAKNEQADLSQRQRRQILEFLQELKHG